VRRSIVMRSQAIDGRLQALSCPFCKPSVVHSASPQMPATAMQRASQHWGSTRAPLSGARH
jgi:hypothetical protein